jgi:phenylacetate-CoA ligase
MGISPRVESMKTRVPAMGRDDLRSLQFEKLRDLLERLLATNRFYRAKLGAAGLSRADVASIRDPDDISRLPFTMKGEVAADQERNPPYGTNLTEPLDRYIRLHQTSGTGGRPIRWLDTSQSWAGICSAWRTIFGAAGIGPGDRLFFPFSFGPFLGFWSAFQAAGDLGLPALPGGGMTSAARLRFLEENGATVVLSTPTYALRLAEVAATEGIELAALPVRALIVAGEPGGSIPAVRRRIEAAWGARCFDHWGMTEVGPLGFEAREEPEVLRLIETHCIAEVIDPATGEEAAPGSRGELVITALERGASPLIRYRTGDLVRVPEARAEDRFVGFPGGIIGRADDMVLIRGNNVYPSAVEAILRDIPAVAEYQARVIRDGQVTSGLRIAVEPAVFQDGAVAGPDLAETVRRAFEERLFFRPEVVVVERGSLPRFEMKGKRFAREEQTA